jgi:hypothetical protein
MPMLAGIYKVVEWQQRFRRNKFNFGNVISPIVRRVSEKMGKERCGANKANTSAIIGEGGRYARVLTSSGQNFHARSLSTYQPKPVVQLQESTDPMDVTLL